MQSSSFYFLLHDSTVRLSAALYVSRPTSFGELLISRREKQHAVRASTRPRGFTRGAMPPVLNAHTDCDPSPSPTGTLLISGLRWENSRHVCLLIDNLEHNRLA